MTKADDDQIDHIYQNVINNFNEEMINTLIFNLEVFLREQHIVVPPSKL